MRIAELLLPEFDAEMVKTRRVLERVPSDKGTWRPHPKSFPIGHLAQLVAWMPGWIATTINEPRLDIAAAPGYTFEPTEQLLAMFDENVRAGHAALARFDDADFATPWQLTRGDVVLFTAPRGVTVKQHLNHLVHHRAQLGVYLRLLDLPVPSMYGPSADERMF